MIGGAIFDVDGVLLDSMGIWMDVAERYLQGLGVETSPDLGKIMWTMSIKEGAEYLKKQYNLELSVEEIIEGELETIRDYYYNTVELKKGVKEFLKLLWEKKIPMIIASSSQKEYIQKAFERHGINQFFEDIVTPEEVGSGKTNPAIYQVAARKIGADIEKTYVFEDALHAIKTAKAAGFRTVGVYDRYSDNEQEEIEMAVDFYLKDLTNFDSFWEDISK